MLIHKIAFEQLFPTGAYSNQRLRVEISLDDKDDSGNPLDFAQLPYPRMENEVAKAFETAKQLVNDAFQKINPDSQLPENHPIEYNQPETQYKTNEDSKISATQRIINQINECSDETVLGSFKLLVKSNPELQHAYDQKLKTFQ